MRRGIVIAVGASLAVHGAVLVGAFGRWPHRGEPVVVVVEPRTVMAGETFDIAGVATATATPTETATATPTETGETRTRTRTSTNTITNTSTNTITESSALTYGAVGDRSAVEIAVAFTRTFPQAASTDLLWESAAFGDAGSADVTFEIADDGSLVSWNVSGGSPSVALKSAIDRTMALVNGRTFVGLGRVTKIRVTAQVSPDQVHDGLHGDVFAVGGSYAGGVGSAFFALSIGRRVDLTVRALP